MNVDGDFFKQAKDINKQAAKDTTSKESLKNMAIAGVTAGLTFGIAQGIDALTSTTNAAALANTELTLTTRFTNALQNSAIQTVSSSAAQSAINGDSFGDALKNSAKNLIINAVGEVAANSIGSTFHGTKDQYGNIITAPSIGKPLQLTLHAALGCGMAAAGGNNCAAGAAAGVIGESVGELLYNNGNGLSKQNTIAVSPITGALAAAMISGPDDGDSVFAGSQIARNAVENNALSDGIGVSSLEEESQNFKESQDEANEKLKSVKTDLQVDLADVAANSDNQIIKGAAFTGLTATNILFPESVEEIGLGAMLLPLGYIGKSGNIILTLMN